MTFKVGGMHNNAIKISIIIVDFLYKIIIQNSMELLTIDVCPKYLTLEKANNSRIYK